VSPRDWKECIQDILEAIDEIQSFTHEMDYSDFSSDTKTLKAVELNLIIIGEATNQIPEQIQDQNPQIPWALMRAMRNRLAHAYFSIDEQLLWDTVQNDLSSLSTSLKSILKQ